MKSSHLGVWVAVGVALAATTAVADDLVPAVPVVPLGPADNVFGKQGTIQLGGSISGTWMSSLSTFGIDPEVGYFIRDMFELTAIVGIDYTNTRQSDGTRVGNTDFDVLLEPSYHVPLSKGTLLFGGLGVGVGYAENTVGFDLVPRVGVNIEIGKSGVFSPAIKVPILIGSGVTSGVELEAGFSTAF
jgi:opacity protein-like surface antigen